MAAICSVCAEPFTRHVSQFSAALIELGPAAAQHNARVDTSQAALPAAGGMTA